MTFEQFQATREHCPDIGEAISADMGETKPCIGNLYLGCLYIEQVQDHWPAKARAMGKWHLLIGREDWISDDLETLERKLYQFATDEGYFE